MDIGSEQKCELVWARAETAVYAFASRKHRNYSANILGWQPEQSAHLDRRPASFVRTPPSFVQADQFVRRCRNVGRPFAWPA